MAPPRKSRGVNKRYSYINEVSPKKDEDCTKRSSSRKRKLADMLGPRWSMEELIHFYDSYRKNGKDWKKVAGAVRNRTAEMIEALYSMNKAYLSLPHGTASSAGLIAMMTDHYSNLVGSDSDQESDGVGSSRRAQKRPRGKFTAAASRALDEQNGSHSLSVAPKSGCVSLLKKKSSGTRPRPVGKRTPRFPVSFSHENTKAINHHPSNKLLLKLDDEVPHKIALALAEASQREGSPQVSGTPSKIAESVMSSPFKQAQGKHSVMESANLKMLPNEMDEEDIEGSTEADTGDLGSAVDGVMMKKGRKHDGKIIDVGTHSDNHSDDVKGECSGTEEGHMFDAVRSKFDLEDDEAKIYKSFIKRQRKKSTKALFIKDEGPEFDALQTLAALSLMMPTENEDESKLPVKDENQDNVDETAPVEYSPVNRAGDKRKSSGVRTKGRLSSSSGVASSKTPKRRKGANVVDCSVLEDSHIKSRKRQKTQTKIQKTESNAHTRVIGSPEAEAGESGKKAPSKIKKTSQNGSPTLMKTSENSSKSDVRKEGSDTAQSAVQVPSINQVSSPTKVRSRRKKVLKKPEVLKISEKRSTDLRPLPETASNLKEKLSNCLSNPLLRRFCTFEWFYSGIDYPWFAKREFDEYLHHVGLGHVPRLTHVEWSFIRSSLGKPRRFSQQFLKQEKEKLYQYRDSFRKHYAELREGVREGVPTDLARPLSVGQRVVAIHPKTREIHDGSVLTVDHSKCRVQFNRNELGVEFVMDIDCMPLNPVENIPAIHGNQTALADRYFEANGQANEYENPDDIDLANLATSFKESKAMHSQPSIPALVQAKEADVQALALLYRALQKKDAIVAEIRQMNDDLLASQRCGDGSLKDSEQFKKQYAAVLILLNEADQQVSSAIHCLRERNTYQGNRTNHADHVAVWRSFDRGAVYPSAEAGSQVNDIMNNSRIRAQSMVDTAIQALKSRDYNVDKMEEAIDYVNGRIPSDDLCTQVPDQKPIDAPEVEAQIPSDLIVKCIATLLMIQKCTERQFPPSEVAQILDSAVTSLQPRSSKNLPVYIEIQKCVGIIKNQVLALIPT